MYFSRWHIYLLQHQAVSIIILIDFIHWIFNKILIFFQTMAINSHLKTKMDSSDHGKSGITLGSNYKMSRYYIFMLLWQPYWIVHNPANRRTPQLVCDGFWKPHTHTYHHTKFQKLVTKCTILWIGTLLYPSRLLQVRHKISHCASDRVVEWNRRLDELRASFSPE